MPRTPSRSKSQRSSEGTATIDKRSPRTGFLDLPAELRNDIYRMCLGTSQILDICNIPHHEYREKVESGSRPLRSAYATPDLTKNVGSRGYGMPGRMLPSRDEITTYVVDGPDPSQKAGVIVLLAINHQVRQEAASILYGENVIYFTTVSSIVPFLKDRTPETRPFITNIELYLTIQDESWRFPLSSESSKAGFWSQSFAELARLPYLSLEKVSLVLDDYHVSYYEQGLKPHLHRPELKWLHHMSNISSLHILGVQYISESYYDEYPDSLASGFVGDELWEFLAPKMLKNVDGEDHNAMGLQHRRLSMPYQ